MAALAVLACYAVYKLSPDPVVTHSSWLGQPLPFFGSVLWGKRSQSRNSAWAGVLTGVFMETGSEFPAVCLLPWHCFRSKKACTCMSWVESKFLTSLVSYPLVFKPVKSIQPSVWDFTVWDPSMCFKLLTPRGGSLSMCNHPLLVCPLLTVQVPT